MSEKVLGYVLLSVGIVVILAATFSIFRVFTGRVLPVQLFNFSGISLDPNDLLPEGLSTTQVPAKKAELISPEILNDTTNIFTHLMFMGFIASAGYKLASIGAMLVRPIKVKMKEASESKPQSQT